MLNVTTHKCDSYLPYGITLALERILKQGINVTQDNDKATLGGRLKGGNYSLSAKISRDDEKRA